VLTGVFNAVVTGKTLGPKQQKQYTDLQIEYKRASGKPLNIHKGSGKFVAAVAQEVDALNKEAALAESLLKVKESKKKASAQVATPKAPESKPQPVEKEIKAPDTTPKPLPVEEVKTDEVKGEETKPSTVEEEAATVVEEEVTDSLSEFDTTDLDRLPVNVGTEDNPIMKPYDEAKAELDKEISEYESILKCCNSKR
jgi:hypothetical protein